MTPEQLEAHQDNFERSYLQAGFASIGTTKEGLKNSRYGESYRNMLLGIAWQAYQWALADAQRAAPVSGAAAQQSAQQAVLSDGEKEIWAKSRLFSPDELDEHCERPDSVRHSEDWKRGYNFAATAARYITASQPGVSSKTQAQS